jgi:hypothetical protein
MIEESEAKKSLESLKDSSINESFNKKLKVKYTDS